MSLDERVRLLNQTIEALLASVSEVADLHELLRKVSQVRIRVDKRGVSTQPWALLPLHVCEAVSGEYEKAVPAAATIQLLNAAAELFDDVEDADIPDAFLAVRNPAVAVNAATALVVAAQRAITQFESFGIDDGSAIKIADTINAYYTKASAGQHLDITLTPEEALSEDRYLEITYMKSACTVECASHVGALSAGAGSSVIEEFCSFGRNLGMAAQVANDIQGIVDGRDIVSRRITLPVIFALNQAQNLSLDILTEVYVKSSDTEPDIDQVKEILYDAGAVQYAIVQMQLYKQQAMDTLNRLKEKGLHPGPLEMFIK